MFNDLGPGQGVERISIGRSDYQGAFDVYHTHNDSQYVGLRRLIEERNPQRIGINVSDRWNHADGLTHNEYLAQVDRPTRRPGLRIGRPEGPAGPWVNRGDLAQRGDGVERSVHQERRRLIP